MYGVQYYSAFDANGNVTDYVDSNGAVVAHREYDPFGGADVVAGPLGHELKFWFSTKYLDEKTGLYYYGYRYYAPELGRWLNEDPFREAAFITHNNLHLITYMYSMRGIIGGAYSFCNNNSVGLIDALGLCDTSCSEQDVSFSISKEISLGVGALTIDYLLSDNIKTCGIKCDDCSCGKTVHAERSQSGGMSGTWDLKYAGVTVGQAGFSWSMGGIKTSDENTCENTKKTGGCNTISVGVSVGPCIKFGEIISACFIGSYSYTCTQCDDQPEECDAEGRIDFQTCAWGVCGSTRVYPPLN